MKEIEDIKNIKAIEDTKTYYIYDEEGQFYEINDQTAINTYLDDVDIYKRIDRSGKVIIFELDKNQIKNYVKYLIKGMEGSRELGAIIFNRYLLIIIAICILFLFYLISQRPTATQIEEIIKNNGIEKNIMQKMIENKPTPTPTQSINNLPTIDINSVTNK